MTFQMKEFGAQVESVWEGLRPVTRHLVERALQKLSSPSATAPANGKSRVAAHRAASTPQTTAARLAFDARAEWELSRLLAALDARLDETRNEAKDARRRELQRTAQACAEMLQQEMRAAEVFAQLIERAHIRHDYARIDALGEILARRFAPNEICELARNNHPVARALAHETLAQLPTNTLAALAVDPVEGEVARLALEQQAFEFGSDEAHRILHILADEEEFEPNPGEE